MYRQVKEGVSISTATTIQLISMVTEHSQVFIGAHFLDAGGNQVTPTAGTVTFELETINSPGNFESVVNGSSMDATAPLRTIDASGNHTRLKVTPVSISGNGVATMVVTITANGG